MPHPVRHVSNLGLISRFAIHAIVLVSAAVTTAAVLGHVPSTMSVPERQQVDAVSDVEFVAFSEPNIIKMINEACKMVRCDLGNLHPAIEEYARNMSVEQMDAARWAQVHMVNLGMRELAAAPAGSKAAEQAQYELSAAARIAAFYHQQMQDVR